MAEFLAELGDFGGDHKLAVGLVGIVFEIILMVILGAVEDIQRGDFGDDGVGPQVGGVEFGADGLRRFLLRLIVIEDGRAVLRADVVALAVGGGGVVDGEEDFQYLAEGDDAGVESDLDDFGVAGAFAADLLVGGVGHVAASVAGDDGLYADEVVVDGFQAPEAAAAKGGDFGFCRVLVHGLFTPEGKI